VPDELPDRPPAELFDVCWRLHLETMRAGHYDEAYHLLATALHCAERAGSLALISGVEGMAALHQEAIDALDPPATHSTAAAKERGSTPLFTNLRGTARAMGARVRSVQVVDRAHRDAAAQANLPTREEQ
jgi:hypothetical protein